MLNPSTDRNDAEAHQALTLLIKQEADRHGIVSFARFMELALYTPNLGFYQRSEKVIGRSGDFFTSVSVGRLFGELLACQFAQWLEKTPVEQPVIVETGAHNGQLANDILAYLQSTKSELFKRLDYWIVEESDERKNWQKAELAEFIGKVRWFHSWTDLSSFRDKQSRPVEGVIFSNELLDAFPFHRLQWDQGNAEWRELGVKSGRSGFEFASMPLSEAVVSYGERMAALIKPVNEQLFWPCLPEQLLHALPDRFITDVCPGAIDWWSTASQMLNSGRIVAIDYGLSGDDFFSPERVNGTARGYRNHKYVDNLLADPGRQDITASVNFSAIQAVGHACGLETDHFESQSKFLTGIVGNLWIKNGTVFSPQQIKEFQTLTHPNQLGRAFNVLVQSRNISEAS